MNDEGRPKAPTESATTDPMIADGSLRSEDRHAAWLAGLEQGLAERIDIEIEDQVHARLHQLSLEALGMARHHAADTGPAWAALIAWAGEPG
jgi:hypothetical protein